MGRVYFSKSSNLGGELGESAIVAQVLKRDLCVAYCTSDCGAYWKKWLDNCNANCKTKYIRGKQYYTCIRGCSATTHTSSQCASECRPYEGGDPDTGVCCYQDWDPDTFECIYYF